MTMIPTLMLAAAVASSTAPHPAPPDTVTARRVQAALDSALSVLVVPQGTDTMRMVVVRSPAPAGSLLEHFVAEHASVVTYLLRYGVGYDETRVLAGTSDSGSAAARLRAALHQDARFNRLFLPLALGYLAKRGTPVSPWPMEHPKPRVALAAAQRLAARFFYPDEVDSAGVLTGAICTTNNGLQDVEQPRNLMVEAFLFGLIRQRIREPASPILAAYDRAMRAANQLGLSTDPAVRVARAQGLMWGVMAEDPALREAIVSEYARSKEWLPFTIE